MTAPVSVYAGKFFQRKKASFKSGNRGRRKSGKFWQLWRIMKKVLFTPLGSEGSGKKRRSRRRLEDNTEEMEIANEQNQDYDDQEQMNNSPRYSEDLLSMHSCRQDFQGSESDYRYQPQEYHHHQHHWSHHQECKKQTLSNIVPSLLMIVHCLVSVAFDLGLRIVSICRTFGGYCSGPSS